MTLAGCEAETSRGLVGDESRDAATPTGSMDRDLDWTQATVESVTDGDTIRLRDGARVRLVQIDTPEVRDHPQCWGEEASDALHERLQAGVRVSLAADPALDDEDQHGRLLRYVALDGEVLNVWLAREGHALPYFFRNDRGSYAEELLDGARTARAAKRGMWGACPGVRLDPGIGI
ncbi:MAG: nuclease [Thermoleophilia bacterium]|nr:nuclease [Thermoleophilia bacterium]